MITELTKLLIKQHEREKEIHQIEYIKISLQDFYRGLIKFIKEVDYEKNKWVYKQ